MKDLLYTARWAIKAGKLDYAYEMITKALGLSNEPERPSPSIEEKETELLKYEMPTIVRVPGVKFKVRGQYKTKSKKAQGLVVHYTVSGRTEKSAKGVVNYLAKEGLGCMVMDENGIIYVPENFDIEREYAYHAGTSSWLGKSGISAYCMGMEICCWGRDSKVGPFRESKGEANIKKGKYQAYTEAQEKALINFIKWQMDVNPEFSVDWVVGHDEIAPTRKSDPGASLSMTMPEFRKQLR